MKKQIRLLIENLFDDEFNDIYNNVDLNSEITDKYMGYKVGDIVYENKKPYAICCGDKKDFKDEQQRFCLLNHDKLKIWSKQQEMIKELGYNEIHAFYINSKIDRQYINEKGYENTQIIKNNYDLNKFSAFKYCCKFGDNVYLPAIDELQVLYLNKNKLKNIILNYDYYWSSTQYNYDYALSIGTTFDNRIFIAGQEKIYENLIKPFIYLN